ncbi:MAG: Crp/Fnr family transcriptional regulator [Pygmaiobacter massiliensis]|jgi:CRP/FNR family transcriptional regulator|nr:Crp/Fnr family transcriptional regulator [Pygmaiobacter massiliensis]
MQLSDGFLIWNKLTQDQQRQLSQAAVLRTAQQGELLHAGQGDCQGLLVVADGQLRAYILSDQGRQITLYRLFERDVCLFSASCMMQSIQFSIAIEAEKPTKLWVIPPDVYRQVMGQSAVLANYTNDLMASRFSEVMWRVEQIVFKSFDCRLAAFLLEESENEGTDKLTITHEKIANHLGTAREVVTRMLRYFQQEQMVQLTRGTVLLTDRPALIRLSRQ